MEGRKFKCDECSAILFIPITESAKECYVCEGLLRRPLGRKRKKKEKIKK